MSRTLEEYIIKANNIHKNKFTYVKLVSENGYRRIYLICSDHGLFHQLADTHLKGSGCRKCYYKKFALNQSQSFDEFVKIANQIFNYQYTYIEFIPKSKANPRQIKYTCKEHGIIIQNADNHRRGWGCNKCGYDKASIKLEDTFNNVEKKCIAVHGNKYTYIRLFKTDDRYLEIECKIHGVFTQRVAAHLIGGGCWKCSCKPSSKPENEWLDRVGIKLTNRQCKLPLLGNLIVDGFDPETNTVYEFHGDYWHGNPTIYKSYEINKRIGVTFGQLFSDTIIREEKIKKHYNLVSIWEHDWIQLKKDSKI